MGVPGALVARGVRLPLLHLLLLGVPLEQPEAEGEGDTLLGRLGVPEPVPAAVVARGVRLPVLQRERVGERLGEVLLLPAGLPVKGVLPVACWLRETVRVGLRVPVTHTEGLGERVAAGEALRVPAPLAESVAAAEDTAGERVPLPQAEAAALRLRVTVPLLQGLGVAL